MKTTLILGEQEQTALQFQRNWFTGKFTYRENGVEKVLRDPLDLDTHIPAENIAFYHFTVGRTEKFYIRIIHTWPERFPAFKPHLYEIFVNGNLTKTFTSY